MQRIFSVLCSVYFLFCLAYIFHFVQHVFSVLCTLYFSFCATYIFCQRKYIFHYANEILRAALFSSNREKGTLIYLQLMHTEQHFLKEMLWMG